MAVAQGDEPDPAQVAALQEACQESENPLVAPIRAVTSTVASWFDENETVRAAEREDARPKLLDGVLRARAA